MVKRMGKPLLGAISVLALLRYGREPNYLKANVLWDIKHVVKWGQKVFLLPFYNINSTTPERFSQVNVSKDLMLHMRDGVRLCTDVYLPDARGPFPTIVQRIPYGKDEYDRHLAAYGHFFAKQGYAFVAQDVRGKFGSQGEFDPMVNEIQDSYDTLEWVSQQGWCDGKIGMMGESYHGYTSWAGAMSHHPNLRAISPSTISLDWYSAIFRNGAFALQTIGQWAIEMDHQRYQNGLRVDTAHWPLRAMAAEAGLSDNVFTRIVDNPVRNAESERANLNHRYAEIKIPTLIFGGWYDNFLAGTLNDWQAVCQQSANPEQHWLIVGPWDHEYTTDHTHRIGQLEIGQASTTTRIDTLLAFFDHFLKGLDNDFDDTPRLRYFTIGDNLWHSADQWPLPHTTFRKFYLHSKGQLNELLPTFERPDRYTYYPNNPVDITVDVDLWARAEQLKDRALLPRRPDVLTYDSRPLITALNITGPISVTLYAATTAVDTDFTATLVDLHPDGYAHLIQEGIIRASFRDSDREPTPIERRKVYQYTIDLWATSYIVKAGHKLRVEISSSNFNRYDRNPNTGEPFGTTTKPINALQTIYHSAKYPSHITLPILESVV